MAAALEAVEGVLLQVGREAAGRAVGRAVQGAGAALLGAVSGVGVEAEQLEDGGQADGRPHGGEVDGRPMGDIGLTLSAVVLCLSQLFAAFTGLGLVGVEIEFIAEVGDGDLVDEVAFEDGDLVVIGEMTTLLVHDGTSVQAMLTRTEHSSRFD